MKDVVGAELYGIQYVREKFEQLAAVYDYTPVWPSPLELLSVLETKSGDAIRDEIYEFEDKGGRSVGLRFDFTMGLTRHVTSKLSLPLPAKISCFGDVFRYDEPQKNRYRHFHQWDVEIYGKPHISQDAELVEFTVKFFESLPLPVTVRLSHRSLMEQQILREFDDATVVPAMLRAVDKLQKRSASDIVSEFSEYDAEKVHNILKIAGIRGSPSDVEPDMPRSMRDNAAWSEICSMTDSLCNTGIHNVEVDLGVVRGLDYYTGMVFEVFGKDDSVALAGGGRYDMLPASFGRDMGAAGVAGGVERIAAALGSLAPHTTQVAILYVNDSVFPDAARLAASLRSTGMAARLDVSGRPLKRQMGNARTCRTVIIIAPKEMAQNKVIIRDMVSGTERISSYDDVMASPDILTVSP